MLKMFSGVMYITLVVSRLLRITLLRANQRSDGRSLMQQRVITSSGLLALIIFSPAAIAQNCKNPMTQMDMNQCAGAELTRETARLNATYHDLRQGLNTSTKADLRQVQLAWIKFKYLACKLEASRAEGGSIYSMVLANCLSELTRQRNKELKALKQIL